MLALKLLLLRVRVRMFKIGMTVAMWFEKLSLGVLRVLTPTGPRYVRPSLVERVYLLWIFRNFSTLPVKVLSQGQQSWIHRVCNNHGFIPLLDASDTTLLGTLEQRPPIEPRNLPPLRPSPAVAEAVTQFANVEQRS
jgi:hypothetical protein